MSWIRRPLGGVVIAVAVVLGATTVIVTRGPAQGGGGGLVASCWVNTSAGASPARLSPAASYSATKAFGSFDAAWDACQAGDTIRVVAGSYGAQSITGAKASATEIIGASKATVTLGALTTTAANLTLRDVTVSVGNTITAGWTGGDNVALRNVDILGGQTYVNVGGVNGASWIGGAFGGPGPVARDCPGQHEPFEMLGSVNITFAQLTLWPQAVLEGSGNCTDGHYHLELFRLDQGANNILIERNRFLAGDDSNSATIFITEFPDGSGEPHDITVQGNIFEGDTNAGNVVNTGSPAIAACTNLVVAYNTFITGESVNFSGCTSWPGTKIIGNLGGHQNLSCWGATSWVKNKWQHQFTSTPCGSDAQVVGTSFATDQLGIDATGHLQAGSVAINAGETPSASDYCTATAGLAGLGSIDFDGDARPAGGSGNCDAGADER